MSQKKKPHLKNLPRFLKKRWYWFIANLYRNAAVLPWIFDITHIWRHVGCHVGKNVRIGLDVYFDVDNASMITIEDDVWIASRALILCHRRDMHQYYFGEQAGSGGGDPICQPAAVRGETPPDPRP